MKKSLITLAAAVMAVGSVMAETIEWNVNASGSYLEGQELSPNTSIASVKLGSGTWAYNSGRKGITNSVQGSPVDGGAYIVVKPGKKVNLKLSTYCTLNNCNFVMYRTDGVYDPGLPSVVKEKDFRQKGPQTNDFGALSADSTYYIFGTAFKSTGDLEYVFFKSFVIDEIGSATFSYKVNAVDEHGNELQEIASGSLTEGLTVDLNWSKYILHGDTWYMTEAPYGETISAETDKSITYVSTDIDYFVECEKMLVSRSPAATNTGFQYSGGLSPRHYSASYWFTDPMAVGGLYCVNIPYLNGNSTDNITNLYTRDADGNLTDTGSTLVAPSKMSGMLTGYVNIPAGSSLVLNNPGIYNSNAYMDYLTLKKVEGYTAVITDVELATLYLDMAVTIPSGVTAYAAKVNADKNAVLLTPIAGNIIPAQTGVVIQGSAGEHLFVQTTGGEAVDTDLVGSAAMATAKKTEYVLGLNESSELVFGRMVGSILPACKAYIPAELAAPSAKSEGLKIVFDEAVTTGIEQISASAAVGRTFDLLGRPTSGKGLAVRDGKVVMMK